MYAQLWCQAVIAGVFLLAVSAKARRPAEWVSSVDAMGIVPAKWTRLVAHAVLVSEAATVILVATPPTAPIGLTSAAALLSIFTAGIARTLRRGNRMACHCFGASTTPLGLPHVMRNLILLALCGLGLVTAVSGAGTPPDAAGVALALAAGAVTALFISRMADIASMVVASR
ncbi:MauE/DoxX family redox-associated membrane protein [Phytohabitans sp. LJ34]|uniref:MauE/DoxX family redox-associated membrane protein n=1 Tax=Phytohabitans sp. LJ34 TaxID=3452217 RepID=UPI003F88CCD1